MSEYDREDSIMRRLWPTGGSCGNGGKEYLQIVMPVGAFFTSKCTEYETNTKEYERK
jgi:hypothetical protein